MRGIAILMVIAVHVSGLITPRTEWAVEMTHLGPRGVQLFYVVSAFSLFLSFWHRRADAGFSYLAYFIRRIARIAPMFWFAMVLYLLAFGMAPSYWAPAGITPASIGLTAGFLNGWSPTTINAIIPGGWSVAIEMTFYLVLPICFFLVRNLRSAVIATGICLIVRYNLCTWAMEHHAAVFPDSQQYLPLAFSWEFWLPAQMPVFMLGAVLFFLREKTSQLQPGVGVCWLGAAIALIAASRYLHSDRLIPNHFVAGIGFVLLACALFDRDVRFLDNRFFRMVGKLSFSLYLLHHLVIHYSGGFILRTLHLIGKGPVGDISYAIAYSVVTAISVAMAMITYRLVEQPGINLGAKLAKWATRSTASPSINRAKSAG